MTAEQLSLLINKLSRDADLREKLHDAADFDAALAIAKEYGFEVCMDDWLAYQKQQNLELTDEEIESIAGGKISAECPDRGSGALCMMV